MKLTAVPKPTLPPFGFILRTSSVIFLFLVLAKLLNFFKKILIGKLFGVSWIADAFFAASYFPYYAAIFFEGVLFLGFLPLFSQTVTEKGKEESKRLVGSLLLLTLFLTFFLVGLFWLGSGWFVRELVPGFSPPEQELTRSLFRILSLVVVFITLCSFFRALNSYFEHNGFASSSGLVDAAVMVGWTLLTWKIFGIYAAAWGAVLGAFAAFMFQAIFFLRRHGAFLKTFIFQTVWVEKLFYLLFPMGMIWLFQQIPLVVLNRFGSGMWEGTISAMNISQTVMTVPMGLISHTVLLAVFPSLAKQANETTPENAKETFFQTFRASFFVLIPVGFLLSALARPLAVLFFNGGGISEEGTERIANSLVCFGWATFALYADLFMTQALIAVRKTVPAIFLCAMRALLTYLLSYFLTSWWDYQGLALSYSLALIFNFFIFFPFFFRTTFFMGRWKEIYRYTLKLILAMGPVILLWGFVNRWAISQWMRFPMVQSIVVIMAGSFGVVVFYLWFLWVIRIREIHSVLENLKESWARRGWSSVDPMS